MEQRVEYVQNGKEHEAVEKARQQNGAVLEVAPRHVADRRKVLFPNGKPSQAENTENNHGNDVARLPAVGGILLDAEWEEEQREAKDGQKHTNNYITC